MASKAFSNTLSNLASEKLKDRTQGLEDVRLFLSLQRNIEWMNEDRRQWLKFLQSIFQIVVDEQRAYVSKPTTPALKRLKDAAQAVRLIIEKAAADIPRKAFRAVFNHVLSVIVVRGKLFEPVALEYVKALRASVAYNPHLDHLDIKQWTHAVSVCFAAILGDPIRGHEIVDDSPMCMEDDGTDDSSANGSRKRKAPSQYRVLDDNADSSQNRPHASAGQDTIEICGCIEAFFRSAQAPLLSNGEALLSKFIRFFGAFPNETTAHLSMTMALNCILAELEFNHKKVIEKAVFHLWPAIVKLWHTKNVATKEQLVMAATLLFPYILALEDEPRTILISDLYSAILADSDLRWGAEALDLNALILKCSQTTLHAAPSHGFSSSVFQAGPAFDYQQSLAWSVLTLSASCLSMQVENSRSTTVRDPPTLTRFSKRLKTGPPKDPYKAILADLTSTVPKTVVYRLQLLLFWQDHDQAGSANPTPKPLCNIVEKLLSHEVPEVQNWALLLLATLARPPCHSDTPPVLGDNTSACFWLQIWDKTLKLLHQPHTSRTACYLVWKLYSVRALDFPKMASDLVQIATDIEVQGPPLPSEAASAFLRVLLEVAASDVRSYNVNIPSKVCNRVIGHWHWPSRRTKASGSFAQKASVEPVDAASLFELFVSLSSRGVPHDQLPMIDVVVPDGALTIFWRTRRSLKPLRDWFWQARVPKAERAAKQMETASDVVPEKEARTDTIAVRLIVHLRRLIEQSLEGLDDADDLYWSGITLERLRTMLDLVWLGLAYDAHLDAKQIIRNERVSAQALQLAQVALPRIAQSKWTTSEKATLLAAITPLCLDIPQAEESYEVLIHAGPFSGIRRSKLNTYRSCNAQAVVNTWLSHIWATPGLVEALSTQAGLFQQILDLGTATTSQKLEDADFGPIRVTTSKQMTGRAMLDSGTSVATQMCLSAAMRMLVTLAYFREADRKPVRMRSLVKDLLEDTGGRFILIGTHILEALQSGYLSLGSNELEGIVDKIGTELLPSYEYSHSDDLQIFVVKFLYVTASQWGQEEAIEMPYVDKARRLAAWFASQLISRSLLPWKVRNAYIDLLDLFISPGVLNVLALEHDAELQASRDGAAVSPDTVLIDMLDDVDYRVRFKLAPVMGRVCSYIHRERKQSFAVWTRIAERKSFDHQGDNFEFNITTLLIYSNIMIASDFFRSNAYHPVIVLAALDASGSTSRFVTATLSATAERLGLQDSATLYSFLAPFTLAEQIYNSQEALLIPEPTAFGFPNKQALYSARFDETAPMVLAGPRPRFFQDMCAYAGLDEATALARVFPTYIAYKLTAGEPGSADFELAEQDIALKAVDVALQNTLQAPEMLRSMRDLVVWRLFSFIWEAEYSFGLLQSTFLKCWPSSTVLQDFLQDIFGDLVDPFRPNVLSPPDVRLEAILYSLRRTHPAIAGALDNTAILNSILHRLFCGVAEPPFTSQQLRLLHNAALCMACVASTLSQSAPLLTMALHRLAALIHQQDLLPLASKLFMWTLKQLGLLRNAQKSGLQDETIFITLAASNALKVSQVDAEVPRLAALGFLRDLEAWIEGLRKYEGPGLIESYNRLCVLWPRPVVTDGSYPSLAETQGILDLFGQKLVPRNALGILRRPLLGDQGNHQEQSRVASVLWSILACTDMKPVRIRLEVGVLQTFADLLFASGGEIRPPALSKNMQTDGRTISSQDSAKTVTLMNLCGLLQDTDLATVHIAFDTLSKIVSMPTGDIPAIHNANFEMISAPQIRRLLTAGSAPKEAVELEEVLHTDHWLKLSYDRERWQQGFASLLARVAGQRMKFYTPCSEILAINAGLAKRCLPALMQALLLDSERGVARQTLSTYFELLLDRRVPCAVDVLEIILNLRACTPPEGFAGGRSATVADIWLTVPYLKLAQVAIEARHYSAALLCVELSREHIYATPTDHVWEKDLLYNIYSHLQEPDGFYSISAFDLPDGLVRRLDHEGRWSEALSWHGAALQAAANTQESAVEIQKVYECLARGDLGHLSMKLFRASPESIGISDILPSLAWKTQSWDIPIPQDSSLRAHYCVYDALKGTVVKGSIGQQETSLLNMSNEIIALASINDLTPAVDEQRIRNILALREVLRWREDTSRCLADYLEDTQASFQPFTWVYNDLSLVSQLTFDLCRYESAAMILETRIVLLSDFREAEARKSLDDASSHLDLQARAAERATLLTLSAIARSKNREQAALNAVLKCRRVATAVDHELALATASVLWLQKESVAAIETLRQFLNKHTGNLSKEYQAQLLAQMGTWIATARLEDASTIREQYFEPAWNHLHSQDVGLAACVALEYARFADDQFQEMSQQVAEIDQLDSYTRKKESEVLQLAKQSKSSQGTSSEIHSRRRIASAISQQDRHTIQQFRSSRKALLESAVHMYSHALVGSDDSSDAVFRLCSLWLGNSDDEPFCANARKSILNIPSYRYIELVPQLSARLAVMPAQGGTQFQRTITKLVERLATEHPFHSLFQLYFLFNTAAGHASQSSSQKRRSLGTELSNTPGPMRETLMRLRQHNARMRETTQAVELAIEAYADWASMRVEKQRPSADKTRPMPNGLKLMRLKNLPIPITTVALAIDKSCMYDPEEMPCIVGYKGTYTTAGGVNLPKITDCIGTDGMIYRQLFKGGDDVRQDAVMQQIFGVTNDLLSRDDRTKARQLGVRTYKVIPLTGDCGLLEFVANSQAIGDWLIPAHAKYRPDDMPILEARKMLGERQKASDTERIEVYKKILQRVHPVMRHFFTEKHHVPHWWFQMRLNYSRSAAAMSMVGYVMGLGDRHVSNIMIDTVNGELVPIDFGIAFEAGKQLPTPELVPFRLTPDIVDGFGISGVEGVFRKCSEETIRVLRSKSAVLMTILEVFKYDPLQKWTASASKVKRVQGSQVLDRSDEGARATELTDADRAIRTVSEKLRSDLSVEYNVNDLILQARDVAKLGSIFFGWQPYL